MAYLEERGGRFRIAFRYQGRLYRHNLGAAGRVDAEGCLARVEENLRLLGRGRLEIPEEADLALFLVSDGRVASAPKAPQQLSLATLNDQFMEGQGGRLEANSLATARIHFRHLAATFDDSFDVSSLDLTALERHVRRRLGMVGRRGRLLNTTTVRKEVQTFSAAWSWAVQRKLICRPFPSTGLTYPKTTEKPPLRTRAEIEAQVARGMAADGVAILWESLFLTLEEVPEVLDLVRDRALHPWILPMFTIAAHTGARRSEILRSRIDDFDFASGTLLIREKKRAKGKLTSHRVPVSPFLARTVRAWLKSGHPGGLWTIADGTQVPKSRKVRTGPEPVTVAESNSHLHYTLARARWAMIVWHTFRHSFASNCGARGVDERLIDGWMGHQTEAMRRRYRHLLPDQQSQAIRDVFPEGE